MHHAPENGYLGSNDPRLFSADLYMASMARSGSTFLCNLMTVPPSCWMIVEPWFLYGVNKPRLFPEAVSMRFEGTLEDWAHARVKRTHQEYVSHYESSLAPLFRALQRWGAKEVLPEFHEPTIRTINPKRVLVTVRNIEDVFLSLCEKAHRQGNAKRKDGMWAKDYCIKAAESLVRLCDAPPNGIPVTVSRYEDVGFSADARKALATAIDWELAGDPSIGLAEVNRGYEISRNSSGYATRQTTLEDRQLDPAFLATAQELSQRCAGYQYKFGYV